jgi:hypothetical protein
MLRFRELIDESIRLRLMSDVPLGVFLSGGLDSSAIAALMAPKMGRPLDAFSVAFADRSANELEYARTMARAIGARSHEIVIDDRDFFTALPRLVWHEDEPVAHPSSVPLHFVSLLAQRHVKVVLTGEGSDELLGGYGRYPRALANWSLGRVYASALPAAARDSVAALVRRLPGRAGRLARRSFLAVDHSIDLTFFDNFAAVPLWRQQHLLSPRLRPLASRRAAYGASVAAFQAPDAGAVLRSPPLCRHEILVELLMKQDQMSMSASIESQVPFLDHGWSRFAAGCLPIGLADSRPSASCARPCGMPFPRRSDPLEDGVPRAVRPLDARVVRVVAMRCCWTRGAPNATCWRRRPWALPAEARAGVHAARRTRRGPAKPGALAPYFVDGLGVQTLPAPRPAAVATDFAGATSATAAPRG